MGDGLHRAFLGEPSLKRCLGHGELASCANEAFEGLAFLPFAFPVVSRGLGEEHPYREQPSAWKCDSFSSCAVLLSLACLCLKSLLQLTETWESH